jgi:hypothetical protein
MKTCSIFALLVAMSMAGCTITSDDDDDDSSEDDNGPDDNGPDDDGPDDDGPDDDGPDDDGPDDGPTGDVEPRTGVWDYSDYNPRLNDCNIPGNYGNGGGGFGLVNEGGGVFTVLPNDGTAAFECFVEGADFECPDRATEEAVVDPSYDALLVGQAVADGTFSDPENATGTQTATVECEGSDCGLLEAATGADFPCTLAVDFVIEWRSGS